MEITIDSVRPGNTEGANRLVIIRGGIVYYRNIYSSSVEEATLDGPVSFLVSLLTKQIK